MKYCEFQGKVANLQIGKTAQFWIAYMNAVWLSLQLHETVKRNDFLLYAECISFMPDLFFAYQGVQNLGSTALNNMLGIYKPNWPLRSENLDLLLLPITKSKLGKNNIAVRGYWYWNDLNQQTRQITTSKVSNHTLKDII